MRSQGLSHVRSCEAFVIPEGLTKMRMAYSKLCHVRFTRSRETTSRDGQRSDPVDLVESYLGMGADTAVRR